MKSASLIAVAILALTGCINIDSVSQPTNGTAYEAFNVQLNVSSEQNTCTFNDCVAEIAVTLPESWEISNCSFLAGSATDPQTCNITETSQNSLLQVVNIPAGYKRPGLNSLINTAGNQVSTGVMSFTITPRSAGDFSITYTGSAHAYNPGSNTKSWFPGDSSENNLITVAPAPIPATTATPVPSIGALGLGALSVLVLFTTRQRRVASKKNKPSHSA